VLEILKSFDLSCEQMTDVFSSVLNARFGKRIDGDAFKVSWAAPQMSWWNPPFSRLQDCVVKVVLDDAQGVFISPDWPSDWLSLLKKMAKSTLYFPAGSKVFELEEKEVGPVRWGVYAFYLQQKDYQKPMVSGSMKRRSRREKHGTAV